MKLERLFLLMTILLISATSINAYVMFDQAVDVKYNNVEINLGNLTVLLYRASIGGTPILNRTFTNKIVNGSWDIYFNITNTTQGETLYKDYRLNAQDIDFKDINGTDIERLPFTISFGETINATNNIYVRKNITSDKIFSNLYGTWNGSANYYTKLESNQNYLKNENSPYLSVSGTSIYRNLTLNESKLNDTIENYLTSIIYYPNSTQTISGTSTTNNITLLWYYDSNTWNISEGNGVDALEFRVNFTRVQDFNQIFMREEYMGSSGHEIYVYLWDYNNSVWESYFEITDQESIIVEDIPVLDSNSHIQSGKVQLRFLHIQNGISSHRFYIDTIQLIDGISTISNTEHDGLSGRDNKCTNHPWVCNYFYNTTQYWSNATSSFVKSSNTSYLLTNGQRNLTGNWVSSNYNITANTFKGKTNASQINSGTINVSRLSPSGIHQSTYGANNKIPVCDFDIYGRATSCVNRTPQIDPAVSLSAVVPFNKGGTGLAVATESAVLVGITGVGYTASVIPSCTTGMLRYDTTTYGFSCGAYSSIYQSSAGGWTNTSTTTTTSKLILTSKNITSTATKFCWNNTYSMICYGSD